MKTFRPGLRIQILLSLTLLLVAAMVLTGFVVMRLTEQDLVQHKAADGMAVVRAIQAAIDDVARQQATAPLTSIQQWLEQDCASIAPSRFFDEIIVVAKDGTLWTGANTPKRLTGLYGPQLASALDKQQTTTQIHRDLGLLVIAAPVLLGKECIGATLVPVRIDRVLEGLSRSGRLLLFYTGLNALVLLVFGNFLLSRIVIRPVKDLVKTVERFQDAEPFGPDPEIHRNEITRLTISLNRMVKRLAENKERMEAQIRSLEQARQETLRSEKLSSIGRLAAGVAHEVGNPIGAILGYTNLLASHTEDDKEATDYLQRIEKEITRIDTIVRELLDFSRPSITSSAPVDINALIQESVSFFSYQKLTSPVTLHTRLEKDLKAVWADQDQLKQVLINLMFNACDAMEKGGTLTITTSGGHSTGDQGSEADKGPRDLVEIAVSDTGKGIPPQDLDKIFHPFYTTKPPGKGTGLGLAISLRIVESFGGTMDVQSVQHEGATFRVKLPPERRR